MCVCIFSGPKCYLPQTVLVELMSPDCDCVWSLGVSWQDASSAANERGRGLPPLRDDRCHGTRETRRLKASRGTTTEEAETERHRGINERRSVTSFKGAFPVAHRDFFPPAPTSVSVELIWHIRSKEDRVSGFHPLEHFLPSCVLTSVEMRRKLLVSLQFLCWGWRFW